jgi:hypothetical protein
LRATLPREQVSKVKERGPRRATQRRRLLCRTHQTAEKVCKIGLGVSANVRGVPTGWVPKVGLIGLKGRPVCVPLGELVQNVINNVVHRACIPRRVSKVGQELSIRLGHPFLFL